MRTKTATFNVNGTIVERTISDPTFHPTRVVEIPGGNKGYPFRSECSECDWKSRGYVTREAASGMGWAHTADDL